MDRNVILMERDIPNHVHDASLISRDGKNVFGTEEAKTIVEKEIHGIKTDEANFSDETFDDFPKTSDREFGMTRSDGAWWSFSIVRLEE